MDVHLTCLFKPVHHVVKAPGLIDGYLSEWIFSAVAMPGVR